jgi:hypothetical protein
MMFRNLGAGLSSDLIRSAVEETYRQWARRYGTVPPERLRTEVEVAKVKSANPGYCYLMAGWERGQIVRGKLHLWAPMREESRDRETGRRFDSGAEAEEREGPGQKTRRRGSAADGAGLAPALEDLPLA